MRGDARYARQLGERTIWTAVAEALSTIGGGPPTIKIAVAAFGAMRIIVRAAATGRAVHFTCIMDTVSTSVPDVIVEEKICGLFVMIYVR